METVLGIRSLGTDHYFSGGEREDEKFSSANIFF